MTSFGTIARHSGRSLPVIAVAALTSTGVSLALPVVLGRALDAVVAGSDSRRWLYWAVGLIGTSVLAGIVDTLVGAGCVADTTAWLRRRLIGHLLGLGPACTGRFDTGDLVTRVSSNAAEAAQAGPAAVTLGIAMLPPVGSVLLLGWLDPWLAVAFLAGVALVALVLRAFSRHTTAALAVYQETQGRLATGLAESLTGARTIAAAGTVAAEEQRILRPLPELHAHGVRTWLILSRAGAQAAVLGPLVQIAVLIAAGLALVDGRLTAGELFAASQYAALGAGLGGLTGVLSRLARARAGAQRAGEVLTVEPPARGDRSLPAGPGRLEFRAVTVRADDTCLLDAIDLDLPGGATVAVVGRSGAGKSVLAALAGRLRDPDAGVVLLDGIPLVELIPDALRAAVGVAFERPALVGATVGDAIRLGRDAVEVEAVARATDAHGFISKLPRGYDTPLAEAPMSGGEAQRVGLARAWPAGRLLVLDDATSSLDMVTELQISRTLTDHSGQCSRLVVTHRASTAARADLVVWLESGRVRAVGPHAELWSHPDYRAVYG